MMRPLAIQGEVHKQDNNGHYSFGTLSVLLTIIAAHTPKTIDTRWYSPQHFPEAELMQATPSGTPSPPSIQPCWVQ